MLHVNVGAGAHVLALIMTFQARAMCTCFCRHCTQAGRQLHRHEYAHVCVHAHIRVDHRQNTRMHQAGHTMPNAPHVQENAEKDAKANDLIAQHFEEVCPARVTIAAALGAHVIMAVAVGAHVIMAIGAHVFMAAAVCAAPWQG